MFDIISIIYTELYTQSPRSRSGFHFEDGVDVSNPAGLSLRILPRKRKSSPMPPTKVGKSRAIPPPPPVCPRGQPLGWPLIKCIRLVVNHTSVTDHKRCSLNISFYRVFISVVFHRESFPIYYLRFINTSSNL